MPESCLNLSKYFYDLDETLNTKSTNPPLEIISKLATELKTEIGGKTEEC
jgi:hypothetical protein